MTTLAADQLITVLEQPITVDRDLSLAGIRPRLYFHNMPEGTFYFNFYKGALKIKSYSFTSLTAREAIDSMDSYFWIDLALPGALNLGAGEYTIKLESFMYSFSSSSWVGLVKDYTDVFGKVIGNPEDFSEYPYAIKLIEYKEREVS